MVWECPRLINPHCSNSAYTFWTSLSEDQAQVSNFPAPMTNKNVEVIPQCLLIAKNNYCLLFVKLKTFF